MDIQLDSTVPRCTLYVGDNTGLDEPIRVTLWRDKADYAHVIGT